MTSKRNRTYSNFDKLNQSAKELFFALLDNYSECDAYNIFAMVGFDDIAELKSPIEQMFIIAYYVALSVTGRFYWLNSQEEIKVEGHNYIVDFLLENGNGIKTKLIVECDGHDFHEKTKEQVTYDNQRDYNLKMQGYEVIHFSGSEIYNNPMKCALKVIDFIDMKEGG